ncbi:restriction endonuclease subunit S [Candidatus Avelusimicrobium faecicola]|uniref:restriction endonuclease subunit S n=1 Tax=Candidatus Avelusimicrobium faecicola TaxID=3416205 RepID=UPI0015A158FB
MQAVSNVYNGNSISETEKAHEFTNLKSGYNYISTKDINFDATIDYNNGLKIPFIRKDFKIAPKNTPLLCIEGGSAGRKLGFLTEDVCFGNKLCAFVSPFSKWIYYYLQSDNFQNYFKFNRNGLIGGVSINKLKKALIPVPPLAEQKRIVKKIEELFGVIDEQVKRLEATHAALVSYRQSVLTDCLRKAAGVSTTLGKTVKPRRERVTFNGTNGNMIFIGMDCIESNALKPHKTDLLRNTKSTCFIFHKDDVLYGRMRSYLNKVFKAETNGAASAEFIVFPPTKDILPDYLKYLLHQQDFVSFATRNASGDRPRVKFEEDLAPFPFTLPSLPEQKAIVKKIENAFAFADKAQAAITGALEQAKQLKQSILKRAFEGKLVPQDPNDKPVDLTQIKKDKHK